MEITETVSQGLHREFRVVVDAKDLDQKLTSKLTEMQPRVQLKGFRPGKAPVSYLKKAYGKSLMGEIVQDAVNESSKQAIKKHELKPAITPRIDFTTKIETVIEGKADLEYTMKVDLMPDFQLANISDLRVERLVADVGESDVDELVQRIADTHSTFVPKAEGAAAEKGDAITIDFQGTIDGTPFQGGSGEGFQLVLGLGGFIPGFEEQLMGMHAGEKRDVTATFPEDYDPPHLSGKKALFVVTLKEIKAPETIVVNEDFAKRIGMESLAALRERVRGQARNNFASASRTHLKRRLLDALDAAHDFELPQTMVDYEFDSIWRQVQAELAREHKTFADEGKTEDEFKKDYREIAERRVRLGLVLSKIGDQNGIEVGEDEITNAVLAQARAYPGQEQKIIEFYQRNPQAVAEIRAPIFEDKVVDFIAELASITDRKVDRDTLFMDPDDAAQKLQGEGKGEKPSAKAKPKPKADDKPRAKKK